MTKIVLPLVLILGASVVACFAQSHPGSVWRVPRRLPTQIGITFPDRRSNAHRAQPAIPSISLQPRGIRKIPVCDPISVTTINFGIITANPLGVTIPVGSHFIYEVMVDTAATGTGLSLGVILQNSCDGGQTWNDIGNVSQTNPGTYVCPISTIAPGSTSISAVVDGLSGRNTVVQGPVGDLWRIKYDLPGTTYTGGAYTFQAFLIPQ